jgi:hypothetical protein
MLSTHIHTKFKLGAKNTSSIYEYLKMFLTLAEYNDITVDFFCQEKNRGGIKIPSLF